MNMSTRRWMRSPSRTLFMVQLFALLLYPFIDENRVGQVLSTALSVGVLFTFRIAGPVYRFEQFLSAVVRGERPRDFRLRKGDQLTELAALINDATRPLREAPASKAEVVDVDAIGAALPSDSAQHVDHRCGVAAAAMRFEDR